MLSLLLSTGFNKKYCGYYFTSSKVNGCKKTSETQGSTVLTLLLVNTNTICSSFSFNHILTALPQIKQHKSFKSTVS